MVTAREILRVFELPEDLLDGIEKDRRQQEYLTILEEFMPTIHEEFLSEIRDLFERTERGEVVEIPTYFTIATQNELVNRNFRNIERRLREVEEGER